MEHEHHTVNYGESDLLIDSKLLQWLAFSEIVAKKKKKKKIELKNGADVA